MFVTLEILQKLTWETGMAFSVVVPNQMDTQSVEKEARRPFKNYKVPKSKNEVVD